MNFNKHYRFFYLCLLGVGLSCCQSTAPEIDLTELTITEIHEAYQAGTYSSEDLVKAYMAKIEAENEIINALTIINPNAIETAKKLDQEYQLTKTLRPLHGVPIIVKDNINTIGLPTTAGALALKDFIPETDAFIIKGLKDAGAIILAKSNMAEWAFSAMHTESSTAGTTRNPYDLAHVPAGSSGGTAAAVSANLGAVGLGTDTGNSIRGPSSHCALVGFRTTLGLISREGIVPLYLRNDVVGPMCRTVTDATKVLEAMIGVDAKDPITENSRMQLPNGYQQFLKADGLQNARIGVLRELSEANPDPAIRTLFEAALVDLEKLGATVVDPATIPDFAALRQNQWCADFGADVAGFLQTYVKKDTLQTVADIIRVGTKSDFADRRLQNFVKNKGRYQNPEIPCEDAFTDQRRIAFRKAIEYVMDSLDLDAIVYPTWNNPPARIENFEEEYLGDNNQIIAPHTGQPAFTVPMGYTPAGLPTGLQFLGRMFDEPKLISFTYSYEQGTKHRVPPKLAISKK